MAGRSYFGFLVRLKRPSKSCHNLWPRKKNSLIFVFRVFSSLSSSSLSSSLSSPSSTSCQTSFCLNWFFTLLFSRRFLLTVTGDWGIKGLGGLLFLMDWLILGSHCGRKLELTAFLTSGSFEGNKFFFPVSRICIQCGVCGDDLDFQMSRDRRLGLKLAPWSLFECYVLCCQVQQLVENRRLWYFRYHKLKVWRLCHTSWGLWLDFQMHGCLELDGFDRLNLSTSQLI